MRKQGEIAKYGVACKVVDLMLILKFDYDTMIVKCGGLDSPPPLDGGFEE